MNVTNFRISTANVEATIKTGLLKKVEVTIPTKKLMYVFSDPQNWGEIDKITITKPVLDDFMDTIDDMLSNGNSTFAELLLKVAGKHPNQFENIAFKEILKGK